MKDVNAYKILNLPAEPSSLTIEQVKFNYKTMARQLHPDKCGSRLSPEDANAAFQALTNAYRYIIGEVRAFENASFDSMKKRFQEEDREYGMKLNDEKSQRKFSLRRFNKMFDSNRLNDPVDDAGYAEWMKVNNPDQPLSEREIKMNRQMILYKEPEPVYISRGKGYVPYTELGIDRVSDYSRNDTTSHGIQFTDYRVAHTTTKLIDESIDTNQHAFDSLEALNQHRAAVSYQMSDAELEEYERIQEEKKCKENERMNILRRREELYANQYNKLQNQIRYVHQKSQ